MPHYGFIQTRLQKKTRVLIDMIKEILDEYGAYKPLAMRQIYYRAIGNHGYDKSEKGWSRLLYASRMGRRNELIPFDDIRDDGAVVETPFGYNGVEDYRDTLEWRARTYRRDRSIGQDTKLILMCESAGMVPQLERIAREYGVEVRSCGGYDSVTAKYNLVTTVMEDPHTIVLHIGDADPSGKDMFENLQMDVSTFVGQLNERRNYGFSCTVEFVRIAVTDEQIRRLRLPDTPKNLRDSRAKKYKGKVVQVEAIAPDVLNEIVRDAITSRLDLDEYRRNLASEERERRKIMRVIKTIKF